ncbi:MULTISPECIES: hypothetical protein [unclassified Mycolicibacterium]|uniref:hypothetical protein n=1 Tax=unclassified Mycolicibacterium TaxID=2636767 RepID=UPI002ED88273
MLLGVVDVFDGCVECAEAARIVGDVDVEARVESSDMQARVVLLGSMIAEDVGGIESADVPDQRELPPS